MNILIRLEYDLIKMVDKYNYGCNNTTTVLVLVVLVLVSIGIGGIGIVTSLVI